MRTFKFVLAAVFTVAVAACVAPVEPQEGEAAPSAEPQSTCVLWQYTCTTTHYLYEHDLAFCQENCKDGTCKKVPDCR